MPIVVGCVLGYFGVRLGVLPGHDVILTFFMELIRMSEQHFPNMTRVIAKAWADEAYKTALISDPVATIKAEGIPLPEGITMSVVIQPSCQIYIVLPPQLTEGKMAAEATHLNEQPFPNMGCVIAKAWTDEAFKTALVADPVATIKAEGMSVPEGGGMSVVVHPSCQVYVILPPKG
ncbi:hypothetical protein CCP4SC76_7420002 [Gammaproteobacteria bacterium]